MADSGAGQQRAFAKLINRNVTPKDIRDRMAQAAHSKLAERDADPATPEVLGASLVPPSASVLNDLPSSPSTSPSRLSFRGMTVPSEAAKPHPASKVRLVDFERAAAEENSMGMSPDTMLRVLNVPRTFRVANPVPTPLEEHMPSGVAADQPLARHVKSVTESLTSPWCIVPPSNIACGRGPPVVLSPLSHEEEPINPATLKDEVFEVDIAEGTVALPRPGSSSTGSPSTKQMRLSRLFKDGQAEITVPIDSNVPSTSLVPKTPDGLGLLDTTNADGRPRSVRESIRDEEQKAVSQSGAGLSQARQRINLNRLMRILDRHQDDIERPLGEPFSEKFGVRVRVECRGLRFNLDGVEPYFCTMALYDISSSDRRKISEDFHFNVSPAETRALVGTPRTICEKDLCHIAALFSISFPSPDVYLVIRIDKVLQGDSFTLDAYTKDFNNPKLVAKYQTVAKEYCSRLGAYRMPFAWTAHQMFTPQQEVNDNGGQNTMLSNIFKQESDRLKDEDLMRHLVELRKGGMKKLKVVTGRLALHIREIFDGGEPLSEPCLSADGAPITSYRASSSSLQIFNKHQSQASIDSIEAAHAESFSPPAYISQSSGMIHITDEKSARTTEVLEFPSRPFNEVATTFSHCLYVSPISLNLSNHPSKARTVAVRVELWADDSRPMDITGGLPCLYNARRELVRSLDLPVIYHNKSPEFYAEVKIRLPLVLTSKHHLRFAFYHVTCQTGKKATSDKVEQIAGYAFLPLLQPSKDDLPGPFIRCDEPIMLSVHQNLTPGYLSYAEDDTDHHRRPFRLALRLFSSIMCQDRYLHRFLVVAQSDYRPGSLDADHEWIQATSDLAKASPLVIIHHLPVALNALLKLCCAPSIALANSAFSTLVCVVNNIHVETKESGRDALLASYITFVYSNASVRSMHGTQGTHVAAGEKFPLFERIAALFLQLMRSDRSTLGKQMLKHAWFFFDLLVKSATQHLVEENLVDRPRRERFSTQFGDNLASLVDTISRDIHERLHSGGQLFAKRLNQSLAFFLRDLFEFFDRGVVLSYIQKRICMTDMLASSVLLDFKLDFLRVVCTSEHYVRLNLPFTMRPGSSPDEALELDNDYRSKHFLASLLLTELESVIDSHERTTREHTIRTIRQLLSRISQDTRYAEPAFKSRVASLHFPLISLVALSVRRFTCTDDAHGSGMVHNSSNSVFASRGSVVSTSDAIPCDSELVTPGTPSGVRSFAKHTTAAVTAAAAAATKRPVSSPRRPKSSISEPALTMLGPASTQATLGYEESRDLLLAFLNLIRDIHPDVLERWWRENEDDLPMLWNIIDTLRMAVITFQYPGRATIGHRVQQAAKSTSSHDAKKMLEDTYSTLATRVTSASAATNASSVAANSSSSSSSSSAASRGPSFTVKGALSRIRIASSRSSSNPHSSAYRRSNNNSSSLTNSPVPETSVTHSPDLPLTTPMSDESASSAASASAAQPGQNDTLTPINSGAVVDHGRVSPQASTVTTLQASQQVRTLQQHQQQLDVGTRARVEAALSVEVALTVMERLELFIDTCGELLDTSDENQNDLLEKIFMVLLALMCTNQSASVVQHVFALFRSFVERFQDEFFIGSNTEFCAKLTREVLSRMKSVVPTARQQATSFLYMLLVKNREAAGHFNRVKVQTTIALSQLVSADDGEGAATGDEASQRLRGSLRTVLTYAERDLATQGKAFVESVRALVQQLETILEDSVKMKRAANDPDMMIDLQYRLANSYVNTPDVRITWLENMAQVHQQHGHWAEAAQCVLHQAALVAEYLNMIDDQEGLPKGCNAFMHITPNVALESAVTSLAKNADKEGICESRIFSVEGLTSLLERSLDLLEDGELYELIDGVYKLLLPIYEVDRDYAKLRDGHDRLRQTFEKVLAVNLSKKRILGSFFRVGFYGSLFGDWDMREFVYKEPKVTPLAVLALRLREKYNAELGEDNFELIQDSGTVDINKLDSSKAYVQLTHVVPYFNTNELRKRVTYFEQMNNLRSFIYETPFTDAGGARGDVALQRKRKTILSVEREGGAPSFPYMKRRLEVIKREEMTLLPIECAIEEISNRTLELTREIQAKPPNMKMLQMILQGAVNATVNAGPLVMARAFLGPEYVPHPEDTEAQLAVQRRESDAAKGKPRKKRIDEKQRALKKHFKMFLKACSDALALNHTLIGVDQNEYHRDLQDRYAGLKLALAKFIEKPKPVDDPRRRTQRSRSVMQKQHEWEATNPEVGATMTELRTDPEFNEATANMEKNRKPLGVSLSVGPPALEDDSEL